MQCRRGAHEERIARRMASRVVDLLELVEIDYEHRGRVAVATAALLFLREQAVPGATVQQRRQRIDQRLELEVLAAADFLGKLQLGLEDRAQHRGEQLDQRLFLDDRIGLPRRVDGAEGAEQASIGMGERHADVGLDWNLPTDPGGGVGGNGLGVRRDAGAVSLDHLGAERIGPAEHLARVHVVATALRLENDPVVPLDARDHPQAEAEPAMQELEDRVTGALEVRRQNWRHMHP